MNLNDFVVIPSNKAKSVKLNARNLRELRMETVTLAQESKDMEERLLQLKESMSREKEERGRSGPLRWQSGQANVGAKASKESELRKLSAGKVKIRVLKDQPLAEPPRGVQKPTPPVPSGDHLSSRKCRLTGKICGQCEARTAGLTCAECGEDYCVGCFAKFHQKGALKLHRMIPIQMEIQTSVSTLDVVSSFRRQTLADSPPKAAAPHPGPRTVERGADSGQEKRPLAGPLVTQTLHSPHSQILVINHDGVEEEEEYQEEERMEEGGGTPSLLGGQYDEKESSKSFQEALAEWRRGTRSPGGGRRSQGANVDWRPNRGRPVSVAAMGTQVDVGGPGGGAGSAEGRVPLRVEFTQHSLTYMERLLIKRHRRTPIEAYRPRSCLASAPSSPAHTHAEEESEHCLTAKELQMRRYCASLFSPSAGRGSGGASPDDITPGACVSIEVLDESGEDWLPCGPFVDEQKASGATKSPGCSIYEPTPVPEPALQNHPSPGSDPSASPPRATGTRNRVHSGPQTPSSSQTQTTLRASGTPKAGGCPLPRRGSNPGPPTSPSPSLPLHGPSVRPPVTPPEGTTITFSLRSSCSLSPSFLVTSPLSALVKAAHLETPLTPRPPAESSPLPRRPRSPEAPPRPVSPPFPPSSPQHPAPPTPPGHPEESPRAPRGPLSTRFIRPLPPLPKPPAPSPRMSPPLPLHSPSPSGFRRSAVPPSYPSVASPVETDDSSFGVSAPCRPCAPPVASSGALWGGCDHPPSSRDVQKDLQSPLTAPPFPPGLGQPSIITLTDPEAEMSSDSLGRALPEQDSSDEETETGELEEEWRGRATEDERSPAEELELEPDQLGLMLEPSMALRALAQREATESKSFSGLGGFLLLGLDLGSDDLSPPPSPSSVQSSPVPDTHTGLDPLDDLPTLKTGSDSWRHSSSLSHCAHEHLVLAAVPDAAGQPTTNRSRPDTPTGGGAVSARGLRTPGPRGGVTTRRPRPLSVPRPRPVSDPPLPRALSRAAQEIQDICHVDPAGCEDGALEREADSHTLDCLEEELRRIAKVEPTQLSSVPLRRDRAKQQLWTRGSARGGVSDDEREEHAEILRDQQSVLLLP